MAEFRYNLTKHLATRFVSVWFVNPDNWQTESKVPIADDFIREWRLMVEAATKGMTLAQSWYKEQGDKI
ncbi:unnamed protein product [Calypogeia fissa]